MRCLCQRKEWYKQQLGRRDQVILMLRNLGQQEKETHMKEIKQINDSLQEYAKQKNSQCQEYQTVIDKLAKKVQCYKGKCLKLNERIKENTDIIKSLMDKKLSLQADVLKLKEELSKERQKIVEMNRYKSQMKQVISLQQIENSELNKSIGSLKMQVQYLKKEIGGFSQIRDKFMNVQTISEDQYQQELNLLKDKLHHQFCKSTDDILNDLKQNKIQTAIQFAQKTKIFKNQLILPAAELNEEYDQLKKISNYIDYGTQFFLLDNDELKLTQSKKIVKFIVQIMQSKQMIEKQYFDFKCCTQQLCSSLKQRIFGLQEQMIDMQKRTNCVSTEVQTVENVRVNEVINLNCTLKIKLYQLQNIIRYLTSFTIFAINLVKVHQEKKIYFLFAQKIMFQNNRKYKQSKFRAVSIAVYFTQILSKKYQRSKKRMASSQMSRDNLVSIISNPSLHSYFLNFFIFLNSKNKSKNHKIDQLLKERSSLSPQMKFVQIVNQEYLNEGIIQQQYGQLFSRFIFETERRVNYNQ